MSDFFKDSKFETEMINLHRFNLENSNGDKLYVGIREGHPRITVFTDNEDKSKSTVEKMITAPFIFTEFSMMLNLIKQVLTQQQTEFKVDSLYDWLDGEKIDGKVVRATTRIFKDTDDVFKIGISSPKHKEAVFNLLPSDWFKFYKDGSEINKEKLSLIFANAWVNNLESVLNLIHADFSTRKFKKSLK
jgi:hypothetical protein